VFEAITDPETIHGLQGSLNVSVAPVLPLIPGKMTLTNEKKRTEKIKAPGVMSEKYLSRKTSSDIFVSEILIK
jgi:hypothetical protein